MSNQSKPTGLTGPHAPGAPPKRSAGVTAYDNPNTRKTLAGHIQEQPAAGPSSRTTPVPTTTTPPPSKHRATAAHSHHQTPLQGSVVGRAPARRPLPPTPTTPPGESTNPIRYGSSEAPASQNTNPTSTPTPIKRPRKLPPVPQSSHKPQEETGESSAPARAQPVTQQPVAYQGHTTRSTPGATSKAAKYSFKDDLNAATGQDVKQSFYNVAITSESAAGYGLYPSQSTGPSHGGAPPPAAPAGQSRLPAQQYNNTSHTPVGGQASQSQGREGQAGSSSNASSSGGQLRRPISLIHDAKAKQSAGQAGSSNASGSSSRNPQPMDVIHAARAKQSAGQAGSSSNASGSSSRHPQPMDVIHAARANQRPSGQSTTKGNSGTQSSGSGPSGYSELSRNGNSPSGITHIRRAQVGGTREAEKEAGSSIPHHITRPEPPRRNLWDSDYE